MMRNVYLQGELGEKFGKTFRMDADTGAEIFKCIYANRPEFKSYLVKCIEAGTNLDLYYQEKALNAEECLNNLDEGDVTIAAVPAGSKSGLGKILGAIILGFVVLPAIGASASLTAAQAATITAPAGSMGAKIAAAGFTTAGKVVMGLATNLALTGLQQIMAPDPSTDEVSAQENYLFDGNTQNIKKGDPVPVLYGELRVPGRPIATNVKKGVQVGVQSIMNADGSVSIVTEGAV